MYCIRHVLNIAFGYACYTIVSFQSRTPARGMKRKTKYIVTEIVSILISIITLYDCQV